MPRGINYHMHVYDCFSPQKKNEKTLFTPHCIEFGFPPCKVFTDKDDKCSGTEVRTVSIVEKGIWDDLFPLKGEGYIHMKLQFILSEEERNRIGMMIWDFSYHLNSLAESETDDSKKPSTVSNQAPLVKFGGHKDEGYALDWSPLVPGRLVSGDCKNAIHLWEPAEATWNVDKKPFIGHTASVEDLQWSPTEPFVFASCSVDKNILICDTRLGKSPAASTKAHTTDVNVISWSSCMLASGSDDGTFSIRDLRLLKDGDVVAHFDYHKQPITSIECSPHEASTLAVSSSDNQLT